MSTPAIEVTNEKVKFYNNTSSLHPSVALQIDSSLIDPDQATDTLIITLPIQGQPKRKICVLMKLWYYYAWRRHKWVDIDGIFFRVVLARLASMPPRTTSAMQSPNSIHGYLDSSLTVHLLSQTYKSLVERQR